MPDRHGTAVTGRLPITRIKNRAGMIQEKAACI
jgi:hypothetical protein